VRAFLDVVVSTLFVSCWCGCTYCIVMAIRHGMFASSEPARRYRQAYFLLWLAGVTMAAGMLLSGYPWSSD
jgi:hypothetical protein